MCAASIARRWALRPLTGWTGIKVEQAFFLSGMARQRFSLGVLVGVLAAHGALLFMLAGGRGAALPLERPPIFVSLITQAQPAQMRVEETRPVARPPVDFDSRKEIRRPVRRELSATTAAETHRIAQVAERVPASTVRTEASEVMDTRRETETKERRESAQITEAAASDEPAEPPGFNADYLENPAPAYPGLSRKFREEGTVMLRVYVDIAGHPEQVLLHETSGFPRLDERARETVLRWKFVPARQSGQPVAAWVIVPVQFSLKG